MNYHQKATISKLQAVDEKKALYYVEVSFADAFYPGGRIATKVPPNRTLKALAGAG